MKVHELINRFENLYDKSYLELGVGNGKNFHAVNCNRKVGVDINGNGTFTGTTDEFFESVDKDEKWDYVFIDANHDIDFVVRDFNNSIKYCSGWILIHDVLPPSRKYIARHLCSDSFKLLNHFWKTSAFDIFVVDVRYGLVFVKMPSIKVEHVTPLLYEEFMGEVAQHRLYSEIEILEIVNG